MTGEIVIETMNLEEARFIVHPNQPLMVMLIICSYSEGELAEAPPLLIQSADQLIEMRDRIDKMISLWSERWGGSNG